MSDLEDKLANLAKDIAKKATLVILIFELVPH